MQRSPSYNIRLQAASKLRRIDPNNQELKSALVDFAYNIPDDWLRYRALQELWRIEPGHPVVIPTLRELMAKTSDSNRIEILISSVESNIFKRGDYEVYEVIATLKRIMNASQDEDIIWESAFNLYKIDSDKSDAIISLTDLLCTTNKNEYDLQFTWICDLIYQLCHCPDENGSLVARLTEWLDPQNTQKARLRCAYVLANSPYITKDVIAVLNEIIGNLQEEKVIKLVAEFLIKINAITPELIQALLKLFCQTKNWNNCQWVTQELKRITPVSQMVSLVKGLKKSGVNQKLENNQNKNLLCKEIFLHCSKNLPYQDFCAAWASHDENLAIGYSPAAKALDEKVTPIADRLESTAKTQLLWIDARTLQSQTDFSAIAQELCTQIYLAANAGIPPFDVDSAVKLKPRILQIRALLQKQNLALILADCEPHDRLVEFFQEQLLPGLAQFLHVAWIGSRPLEAPLKAFPEQENLLSAIQSWINELG